MPDVRIEIFRELLGQLGHGRPGRYLDLATGHGRFALTARAHGWEVTAVDVRTQRWPDEPGIRWIRSDVRDFDIEPGYDCIGLLGLLYHLELDDQLDLLRRCAPSPLILDTHIATAPAVEIDGYAGKLFQEGDLSAPTASWGNATSFWPTRESLHAMLYSAGYTSVYERTPAYQPDRTFWLCLATSHAPGRELLADDFARSRAAAPEPAVSVPVATPAPVPATASTTPAASFGSWAGRIGLARRLRRAQA